MPPVLTRHVYAGLEPIEEYVLHDPDGEGGETCTWTLAREFIWGARFPEPLVMVDWTAAGDVAAGSEEVLHYIGDALGSVVGLLDAGEPDATPEPVPAKLVERYDYDPYGKTYIAHWDATAGGGSGAWVRHTADEPSAYGNPFMWTGQRHDVAIGLYHFPFRTYSPRLGRWLQRDPLGYVDGVNMYEYVASSPTNFIDALGLYGPAGQVGTQGLTAGAVKIVLQFNKAVSDAAAAVMRCDWAGANRAIGEANHYLGLLQTLAGAGAAGRNGQVALSKGSSIMQALHRMLQLSQNVNPQVAERAMRGSKPLIDAWEKAVRAIRDHLQGHDIRMAIQDLLAGRAKTSAHIHEVRSALNSLSRAISALQDRLNHLLKHHPDAIHEIKALRQLIANMQGILDGVVRELQAGCPGFVY
jgi:RHS repeat-associated protein